MKSNSTYIIIYKTDVWECRQWRGERGGGGGRSDPPINKSPPPAAGVSTTS